MVKPKKEFIVKRYRSIENPSEKVYIVFDGDEMLYDVKECNRLNMKEHEEMIDDCETYIELENFESRKGTKFIHAFDYESEEHFLINMEVK